MRLFEWLSIYGDWRAEVEFPVSRRKLLMIRFKCRLLDWRIGFYFEPGMGSEALGFLEVFPLPTIGILFALYRSDAEEE